MSSGSWPRAASASATATSGSTSPRVPTLASTTRSGRHGSPAADGGDDGSNMPYCPSGPNPLPAQAQWQFSGLRLARDVG